MVKGGQEFPKVREWKQFHLSRCTRNRHRIRSFLFPKFIKAGWEYRPFRVGRGGGGEGRNIGAVGLVKAWSLQREIQVCCGKKKEGGLETKETQALG